MDWWELVALGFIIGVFRVQIWKAIMAFMEDVKKNARSNKPSWKTNLTDDAFE